MRSLARLPSLGALLSALLLVSCASGPGVPKELLDADEIVEQNAPLGGDALAQRSRDLRRAHRDMLHFQSTLMSLSARNDRNGQFMFSGFLDAYMGEHLDPLLRSDWQSRHPELSAVDATLRLVKAEILMHMRETRRMQQTLDEIARRFEGRDAMLVEYPIGQQVPLSEALEILRSRKWRG